MNIMNISIFDDIQFFGISILEIYSITKINPEILYNIEKILILGIDLISYVQYIDENDNICLISAFSMPQKSD